MKQSRSISLLKSLSSTAVGFSISLAAQYAVLPYLLGVPVPIAANLSFAAIMTVISIVRGYVMERIFEMLGWRARMSPFISAALHERARQIGAEGYSLEHDDMLPNGDLAMAGAAYLLHAGTACTTTPHEWPWRDEMWKPQGSRRDLVRGVALGIAEGEKFDRDRKRARRR
jgi:hypothetical protein